jgi:antibiotic biosynthesis monooxygenase (ABM) superfamily enzyme
MSEATPTVIVSRRVRAGAERDFEQWTNRLRSAAERFDGYLGSERQPPNAAHPGEWVIVYRFASVAELDAWLSSPERSALMDEGERLLAEPAREQRIVEPAAGAAAVTAVLSQRIRPDAEEAFHRVQARMLRAMEQFEGFLRSDHLPPVPGVQDNHVIVFSFASKADLDRWLESDKRRELLIDLAPLIEGERTLNVIGGFAGWFPVPGLPQPVRWKQAFAVLLALFPTTLTLVFLQRSLVPDAPWVAALFVSNVLGVSTLTWLLMPLVTRWLGGWLRR